MMTVNRLMLSGTVCMVPIRTVSPLGILHCQFMLEHRSVQQEAGFSRQAWCRVPVVVISKQQNLDITNSIKIGVQISVQGFMSCHQGRNGLSKLVLHAEQVDFIKSGD
ncbi:primosomal replication protein N [Candidatus Hoaglandella endobia]|uniref:Replication restart protein PriB n=1 Tax=Candidatus Hoaglandella endobia TaxID=1778263 RepID=A0A143WUR8_9ENTR|nr:primosomal replication protein N [Candidatus Hoaglandella endobia]CUX97392.1 Primosomal replication protein n [Candidatus Hoaglandella endobia]